MKVIRKITNGIILIIIGIMHTQFCLSTDVFGKQFQEFSRSGFYNISEGTKSFSADSGMSISVFEIHAAFWFFYFGLLLFPIGLLVHSIEKNKNHLPSSFTVSYLIVVLIGVYMIPSSGMTFFMLPHAIFMLVVNHLRIRKGVNHAQ